MSFQLNEIQRKFLKEALIINNTYYDIIYEVPEEWDVLIIPIMNIVNKIYNFSYLRGLSWDNYQGLNEKYSALIEEIEKLMKNESDEIIQKLIKNIDAYSEYRLKEDKEDKYVMDFDSTIKANKNFIIYPPCSIPIIINKNELGGKIETFDNLPQNDNSWITEGVKLSGSTIVKNNSFIGLDRDETLDCIDCEINETHISTSGSRTMRESQLIGSRIIDSTIDYSYVESSEVFFSHLNRVEVYNDSRLYGCVLMGITWVDSCQFNNLDLSGNKKYKNMTNEDLWKNKK